MNPAMKRYQKQYGAAADAVSRLDVDQEVREQVAAALADAFDGQADFKADLFRHVASDPLCACAGPSADEFAEPCPHGREIRVSMHLSSAPDGRSAAWKREKPVVRCISCGASVFVPGYADNKEAR
jgi:hypothetical protein